MAHRFSIKEVAHQAGVGTATVDRVLHNRPGVRRVMVQRVQDALRELEAQEAQLAMSGRKLMLDLVVEAPQVFLDALHHAVTRELPVIQTAVFRVRSDLRLRFPVDQIVDRLAQALRLKSDGVILMAPDAAPIRAMVDALRNAGIPVITLASDMPGTKRTSYTGLDNRRAGETAAWMIRKFCAGRSAGRILVTKRNDEFHGETARVEGFCAAIRNAWPEAEIELLVQGREGDSFARKLVHSVQSNPITALYSVGGGNLALLNALERAGLRRPVIVAHDMNDENEALLRRARIDVVLYHDLAEDIRHACQAVMAVHSRGVIDMPKSGATLRIAVPPMLR